MAKDCDFNKMRAIVDFYSQKSSFISGSVFTPNRQTISPVLLSLFIPASNTIIEIKGLLSTNKRAFFPTVYSARAIKQLHALEALLDAGYNVCYFIVSLNPSVQTVDISLDNMDFYDLFNRCYEKGMIVKSYSVRLKESVPFIRNEIPVIPNARR